MPAFEAEFAALAQHLRARRENILQAWRGAVRSDPELTTGDALPRAQLNDHIPGLLESFERKLDPAVSAPGQALAAEQTEEAAAHGLHRWQQGYDLMEVSRELGRLNECMVDELDRYDADHPELDRGAMAAARRAWAELCSIGFSESAAQYFRLQQFEASGHINDLEQALQKVHEWEQERAELWQQVAHDLRGNVGVVVNATAGLNKPAIPDSSRTTFLRILERNVSSLRLLLDDVTQLARLQAGKEQRQVAPVDAGTLLREFCEGLQPYAEQRKLFLHFDGPAPLLVEADAVKLRRLTQNLVLNAIKYTQQGGVTVHWGDAPRDDGKRWMLTVQDTGPGFHAGPGSPLAGALEEATGLSNETRTADGAAGKAGPSASDVRASQAADNRPTRQEQGEGIGLSIVKRIAELLNASVEVDSTPGTGTVFRVLLPRRYAA
ncbi:MAG: sensor histidine kinase [Pseudomonadota bacterium]